MVACTMQQLVAFCVFCILVYFACVFVSSFRTMSDQLCSSYNLIVFRSECNIGISMNYQRPHTLLDHSSDREWLAGLLNGN